MALGVESHPSDYRNPMLMAEFQAFSPMNRVVDDPAILGDTKIGAGGGAQYFHLGKIPARVRFRHGVKTDLHGLRPLG